MRVHNPSARDRFLTPLLAIFWEPFSKKISHSWNWKDSSAEVRFPVAVKGNKDAKPRGTFWRSLWQTNFGWKWAVILEPVDYTGDWHLGYYAQGPGWRAQQWCNVILRGKAAALVGPDDVMFYGVTSDHHPIELRFVALLNKDALTPNIPLV